MKIYEIQDLNNNGSDRKSLDFLKTESKKELK